MDTELVWFEESNWERQKDATHVIFHFKIKNPSIIKVVKDYMESIGMKGKNFEDTVQFAGRKNVMAHHGFCVDMVNKEFWPIGRHEVGSLASQPGYYIGYPSQVIEFVSNHTGRLTGKKFGL